VICKPSPCTMAVPTRWPGLKSGGTVTAKVAWPGQRRPRAWVASPPPGAMWFVACFNANLITTRSVSPLTTGTFPATIIP